MGGISFGSTVVDDDHVFINAFIPTIIEHHYSVGGTYHLNEHHSLHFVYLRSGDNKVTQSRGGDLIGRLAAGSELEVSADSFAVGYSFKF
jgi:long-subunit fatty acid transport protein